MAVWQPSRPQEGAKATNSEAQPPRAINLALGLPVLSAQRLLIFGGIALIAAGMLFGDVFAVFILHQNGGETGQALLGAAQAVAAQNPAGVRQSFAQIGNLLEDRGTKVDAHVHMTDAGYLALLLALVQPYVLMTAARKKFLAKLFLTGGVLLPVGIFLIHYVGLSHSPFTSIGWGSVLADSAGALLIVVVVAEAWGLWKHFHSRRSQLVEPELARDRSWEQRALLSGGTVLILLGFLHGAWYAGFALYEHEARDSRILSAVMTSAAANDMVTAQNSVQAYGGLQAEKAVNIAAHSHIIEFGLLAILLSFVQPYVFLSMVWKKRWVRVLLAGSLILPVFVWLEIRLGLVAGGIADVGGLMVIVALIGMLVGVLRCTGRLDSGAGAENE